MRKGRREVVLQRRSFEKDTFADRWDAAAAGHWRYGETPAEAAREIGEELGLDVNFGDLTYRGRERLSRRFDNRLIDREFHQVYVLNSDRALADYRPDPREVIGLAAFRFDELQALVAGRLDEIGASESVSVASDGSLSSAAARISRNDVVPYSASRLRRLLGPARADC